MKRLIEKLHNNKGEVFLVILLLAISGISHAVNMFHYPYYENDEGTYMSQAWSLLTMGKLAPYTYWYDHAPMGWFLIALWVKLTGGFFTFGMSANSGRVLMMVLHVVTSFFLYYIAKELSGKKAAGVISVLIFSFSPLGIYFQRRVLLDNMMTFWVFASLAILINRKVKLGKIIISSILFGIAILTKENAVFFLPAFLYLIWVRAGQKIRMFGITLFAIISFFITSTYFLYAYLKHELFPTGFLGDTSQHVSLVGTLAHQFSRGAKLPFWMPGSDFSISLQYWLLKDRFTVVAGTICLVVLTLISLKKKIYRIPVLFAWLFIFFLVRGALVINFYIVPLIPPFALIIGLTINEVVEWLSFKKRTVYLIVITISTLVLTSQYLKGIPEHWVKDETSSQVEAVEWIKRNVPENSFIVIDCYPYVDLHAARFPGDRVYPNADWFWKYWYDPEIQQKFGYDWRNVEYILLTHEMIKQIGYMDSTDAPLRTSFLNSQEKIIFGPSKNTFIDLPKFISTNGDWAAIYGRPSMETLALTSSWNYYKNSFIKNGGQVESASGEATSEGQSYALLRAVWMDDKQTYDGVLKWTKENLQTRGDSLFSWHWGKNENGFAVLDKNSASDADEDIALSLIFAYKRWEDPKYLMDAISLINDIWNKEVVQLNGNYYLGFSADSKRGDGVLVNPSYLSPAHYKIFASVDTTHPWKNLAGDSYLLLNKIGTSFSPGYLPPNWIFVNRNGNVSSAQKWTGPDADIYGYDAFRTFYRVALDYYWFNNQDSQAYLTKVLPFFQNQLKDGGTIEATYSMAQIPKSNFSALSNLAGPISALSVTDKSEAKNFYKETFGQKFNKDGGFWGDKNNYYDQNWAWFATGLYSNQLPNLWNI